MWIPPRSLHVTRAPHFYVYMKIRSQSHHLVIRTVWSIYKFGPFSLSFFTESLSITWQEGRVDLGIVKIPAKLIRSLPCISEPVLSKSK